MAVASGAGRGGTGLTGGKKQDRHAAAHQLLHHLAGFLRKFIGGTTKQLEFDTKRPRPPLLFAARNQVQHFQCRGM